MTEQRFDSAFSTKEIIEGGSRTDHSLKDKIEEKRALPQRTSVMCTESPFGRKAGRRHPCDRGMQTGLETQRQGAPRLVECWQSLACASQFDIGQ